MNIKGFCSVNIASISDALFPQYITIENSNLIYRHLIIGNKSLFKDVGHMTKMNVDEIYSSYTATYN